MLVITASQCRAARALLNWTQPELAERSDVHVQTISNFEKDTSTPSKSTLQKIIMTFEFAGIAFDPNDGLHRVENTIVVFKGEDANKRYLDQLYHDMKNKPGEEVLIAGVREVNVNHSMRGFIEMHVDRLLEAGITERLLIEEGDTNFIGPLESYRCIPKEFFFPILFQMYGNKLAMSDFVGETPMVLMIENEMFAKGFKHLFNFAWENCQPAKPEKAVKKSPRR